MGHSAVLDIVIRAVNRDSHRIFMTLNICSRSFAVTVVIMTKLLKSI